VQTYDLKTGPPVLTTARNHENAVRLHVFRHGQTDLNRLNKYQGSIETDLNRHGIAQARHAARQLPEDITALVSSPMRRAVQTAEIISREREIPVETMPEFRERAVGIFEGLSKAEIKSRFPDMWERRLLHRFDVAPPGGESIGEVMERVQAGIERLLSVHRGRQVVLVAHGFVARAVWALVTRPPQDAFFDYALANGDCDSYTIQEPPVIGAQYCPGLEPLCG